MILKIATDPPPLASDETGVIRIALTRVTLDTVLDFYKAGASAEEIAAELPTVELWNVHAAISYYLHHQSEVDQYLGERVSAAAEMQHEIEKRFTPAEFRAKLDAWRNAQDKASP